MSIWRDTWRECVTANRIMAENEEDGLIAFHHLLEAYGNDGMIHYAKGEAYEHRKNKQAALTEYEAAKALFPVAHWKQIAENTIQRIKANRSAEAFFDEDDFEQLLWLTFQKAYEYVHLSDFSRYVALSALSRGSSEWPLALVDFRTVLELELKAAFPEIIELVKQSGEYSLFRTLKELAWQQEVPPRILEVMHKIRKAGNIAAHDAEHTSESDKCDSVRAFLLVLEFFNDLGRNNTGGTL